MRVIDQGFDDKGIHDQGFTNHTRPRFPSLPHKVCLRHASRHIILLTALSQRRRWRRGRGRHAEDGGRRQAAGPGVCVGRTLLISAAVAVRRALTTDVALRSCADRWQRPLQTPSIVCRRRLLVAADVAGWIDGVPAGGVAAARWIAAYSSGDPHLSVHSAVFCWPRNAFA